MELFSVFLQSSSYRGSTVFVGPKTGCVQAIIGLNGKPERHQPANYLKPRAVIDLSLIKQRKQG